MWRTLGYDASVTSNAGRQPRGGDVRDEGTAGSAGGMVSNPTSWLHPATTTKESRSVN